MLGIITHIFIGLMSSTVNMYIVFNFMDRFFEKAYHGKRIYQIVFLISVAFFFITNIIIATGILSLIISFTLIIGIGSFLFQVRKHLDFLLIFIFFLFLILTEFIGQFITTIIYAGNFAVEPGNVVQSLITFFSYQGVMRLIKKKNDNDGQIGQRYLLVIVPLISFFSIITIVYLSADIENSVLLIMATWACILIFLLNLFVFYLFDKILRLNMEKEKISMINQQSQMQYRYLNELEEKNKHSSKILHDIKNHLNVLEEIYTSDVTKAIEYGNSLREMIDERKSGVVTRSRVLNILLYHKAEIAHNHGIKLDVSCEDVAFDFITDIDMNRLFSNLLDNAFDECLQNNLKHNFVNLIICHINNFMVFRISNSCEKKPIKDEEVYISQKKGHMGVGLNNVKDVVEKYNGIMKIDFVKDTFTVQITFSGIKATEI